MSDEQINIAIAEVFGKQANYCNNLNAMHEAENMLSHDQYHTGYKQTLATLVGISGNMRVPSATARQRAEAFLKTIGKWEGAK